MLKTKKEIYWRKLDDQAKVFALASNKQYSSIFRLSIILKEDINSALLQEALELAIEKYKAFKVKLRRGFFWYYFEENDKIPKVEIESEYPFKKVNTSKNNDFLFKITYFGKKINADFFHALTDGSGAVKFLKEIIYRYLELKYEEELDLEVLEENEIVSDTENAYKNNCKYDSSLEKPEHFERAFNLPGKTMEKGVVGINHFNINLKDIKELSKKYEVTISMVLVAMIAYSIYETNYKDYPGTRPINLCVPISLNKYFETETISNFHSYMMISLKLNKSREYKYEDILEIVKKQFQRKLKLEKIVQRVSNDAGKTNKFFIRIVPLVIKKLAVRIGSLKFKKNITMTVSNLGRLEVKNKYSKYIDSCIVILSPDWSEKIKCGICSFDNNLVVSFGTILKDNIFENKFKDILKLKNIRFLVKGNGINSVVK